MPTGKREAVLGALDDEGIDYVVSDETSGREYTAVVQFPMPTEGVEDALDALRDAGLSEDAYTVVLDAETVVSRQFEELRAAYAEDDENGGRIARSELLATAEGFTDNRGSFVAMLVVSAVLATAGALMNSALVLVGANVIVPLIDPAMAASVGSVLRDRDLFRRGVRWQAGGLALLVGVATAFAVAVRFAGLAPGGPAVLGLEQVRHGSSAGVLSLLVALGAGVAGAVSVLSGVSTTLVGVAIAVALVPPAASLGIGVAWASTPVVVASAVLLLVNVLSINLAALVVFWRSGYRPARGDVEDEARTATVKRGAVLVAAILVLASFVGATTYSTHANQDLERSIEGDVADLLDSPEYDGLTLLSVDVTFERDVLFASPERVVVRVGSRDGGRYPGLADAVAARLDSHESVRVEVEVVQVSSTA